MPGDVSGHYNLKNCSCVKGKTDCCVRSGRATYSCLCQGHFRLKSISVSSPECRKQMQITDSTLKIIKDTRRPAALRGAGGVKIAFV